MIAKARAVQYLLIRLIRASFPLTIRGPYSFGPGPLNLIFRSRGRPRDLGNAILGLFGPIWIDLDKVSLKPSVLELNRDIHTNYAYLDGGPLALSLGCRQELHPKA